mmetsp:Transcript_39115/g.110922  ORF Transcript_39115/g.110922 Transcript_39115/m.110922 type:complete len:110 (-) Transcript_39115:538-867(-)
MRSSSMVLTSEEITTVIAAVDTDNHNKWLSVAVAAHLFMTTGILKHGQLKLGIPRNSKLSMGRSIPKLSPKSKDTVKTEIISARSKKALMQTINAWKHKNEKCTPQWKT